MKNKLSDQDAQNLEIIKKIWKNDYFEIQQDLSMCQNSSIKPRQNLNKMIKFNNHEGKKFNCDICSKSFMSNGNFKKHFESAHRGKTFKCDICPSSFREKCSLNKHIESIHE